MAMYILMSNDRFQEEESPGSRECLSKAAAGSDFALASFDGRDIDFARSLGKCLCPRDKMTGA